MTDSFYIECSMAPGMTARDYRFRNARSRRPRWYALKLLLRSAPLLES